MSVAQSAETVGEKLLAWTEGVSKYYAGKTCREATSIKRRRVERGVASFPERLDYYTVIGGSMLFLSIVAVGKLTRWLPVPRIPEIRVGKKSQRVKHETRRKGGKDTGPPQHLDGIQERMAAARTEQHRSHLQEVEALIQDGTFYQVIGEACEHILYILNEDRNRVLEILVSDTPRDELEAKIEGNALASPKLSSECAQLLSVTAHMAALNIIRLDPNRLPIVVVDSITQIRSTLGTRELRRTLVSTLSRQLHLSVRYIPLLQASVSPRGETAGLTKAEIAATVPEIPSYKAKELFRTLFRNLIENQYQGLRSIVILESSLLERVTSAATYDDMKRFLEEFTVYVPESEEGSPQKMQIDRIFSIDDLLALLEDSNLKSSPAFAGLCNNLIQICLLSYFEQDLDQRRIQLYASRDRTLRLLKKAVRSDKDYGDGSWRKDKVHGNIGYVVYVHSPLSLDGKLAWPIMIFQKISTAGSRSGDKFFPI
ncbi:MAG: hypothetical protein PHS44_05280 [Candidatus Dojkabacteria bacterium]|nr:hypothetical protein [Candidatus Dojkabacteria bacterium]